LAPFFSRLVAVLPTTKLATKAHRRSFCGFLQDNLAGEIKCAWPTSPLDLNNFPILGFAYGVFADPSMATAFESGTIYTDDEDSSNSNN
jgi:hypothetical protein